MTPHRSLHEAAAYARTNAAEDSGAGLPEDGSGGGQPPRDRRPARAAWLWWLALGVAVFTGSSVALFGSGPWWLLALPVVAATALAAVAATRLGRLWPQLTGLTRYGGLALVAATAALFGVGVVVQDSLGDRPLLIGTTEAATVARIDEFAGLFPQLVGDARMATWDDEAVRTRQALLEEAAARWQLASQELAARSVTEQASETNVLMVRVQDLTARLLTARVELAAQPSSGRATAFNTAVLEWERAVDDLRSSLEDVADDLGLGPARRTWVVVDPGEDSR